MIKKKKVLFVCIENSCRSQIAEGWARSLGGDVLDAYSAGSQPSGLVNPDAVKVMRETNIDISGQQSKGFDRLPAKKFDYVITLGCGDKYPFVPAGKHVAWNIKDPKGQGMDVFRKVRDDIGGEIVNLIRELNFKIYGRGKNGEAF